VNDSFNISGNVVDVLHREIIPGTITVAGGKITGIRRDRKTYRTFIVPGLVDAHVHVESSMLPPSEFARVAAVHGTVATVSDPHEIANVLGVDGVNYMIEDGTRVPFKFYFSAPSCVPASPFETSGAVLDGAAVGELLERREIRFLGEMMNYPGVLHGDPVVMDKIGRAKKNGKAVDGHAPGLRGADLETYVRAGITTNHESLSYEESREDLDRGLYLQIRHGSAATLFEDCLPLLRTRSRACMLCSDDKHPHDLVRGHINEMVARACRAGIDIMDVLTAASVNPVHHYGLDVGLLQPGDDADFLEVDLHDDFRILRTFIRGVPVAERGRPLIQWQPARVVNRFRCTRKTPGAFTVPAGKGLLRVIQALEGQVYTERLTLEPASDRGAAVPDMGRDLLKIAVVNRYEDRPPAVGFIRGFGLEEGAIASSVAHDSHNIVAVGASDEAICRAVNLLIDSRGGLVATGKGREAVFPLPVAGLMSDQPFEKAAAAYLALDRMARDLGSPLSAPFMTLSFMALTVIPRLKLSDRGLFDGDRFTFTGLFTEDGPPDTGRKSP